MSKVSHLPKNVPSKELPIKLKVKGSVTGHSYEGDFIVTVPGVRESNRIGNEVARLGDGIPFEMLDGNTQKLNNALAFLKVVIKTGPAWFINTADDEKEEGMDYGLDTMDINVPIQLFRQADKAIKGWHEALKGQPKEAETPNEPKV